MILWLWNIQNVLAQSSNNQTIAENNGGNEDRFERQKIYTYFERIDISNRTTGMTDADDDELLRFWKERWHAAGYMPVVLTAKDVWKENGQKHLTQSRYESVQSRLDALKLDDFSRVVFHKWIAMTVAGGGWFSDYDSFPLPSLYRENGGDIIRGDELPNNGHITVYDMISPTLASGSANSWIDVLEALLDDAEEHCRQTEGSKTYHRYDLDCFYTDSLAIHSLRKKQHKLAPHTERKIATPFDKHDPVSNDDTGLCSSEKFVKKWTVHFGPGILQRSGHIPPRARRPKYRLNVAEDWMGRFERLCS